MDIKKIIKEYAAGPSDTHKKALELFQLAVKCFSNKDLENAKKHIDEALVVSESLGPFAERKYVLSVAGDIYSVLKLHEEAAEMYKQALRIGASYDESDVEILLSLGHEYSSQEKLDEALLKYKESLEHAERIGDSRLLGRAYANIGSTLARKGDKEKALSHFTHAKKLFSEINDGEMVTRMDSSIAHYEL